MDACAADVDVERRTRTVNRVRPIETIAISQSRISPRGLKHLLGGCTHLRTFRYEYDAHNFPHAEVWSLLVFCDILLDVAGTTLEDSSLTIAVDDSLGGDSRVRSAQSAA